MTVYSWPHSLGIRLSKAVSSRFFSRRELGNCSQARITSVIRAQWEIYRETALADPDIVPRSTVRANQCTRFLKRQ